MADCKSLKPSACGNRGLDIPKDGCDSIRFEGVNDVELNQGVCIDLNEGVHAYDGDGTEIPFSVSPSEIGCCDVGEHEVTYTARGKGNKMLPSFCADKPKVHAIDCGLMTKTVKRLVTILQALPPKILGIGRTIIAPNASFDAMSGVSGIDDNGKETEVTFDGTYYEKASGEIATFESIGGNAKSLKVQLEPIQEGSGTPSPDNVCPISGHTEAEAIVSPTTDAEDGHTYTTDLGRTVYGGSLDVVSGVLTVDRAYRSVTDMPTNSWNKLSSGSGAFYMARVYAFPNMKYPYEVVNPSYPISDTYAYSPSGTQPNGAFRVSDALYIVDDRYSTISEFREAYAQNPFSFVYELATPQTYQLTPTEVALLEGTNNVWGSGDVEVGYPVKMPNGSFTFPYKGTYEITYDTEDDCGNHTTETRYVFVGDDLTLDETYAVVCVGKVDYAVIPCDGEYDTETD